jgi:hypothetical protein
MAEEDGLRQTLITNVQDLSPDNLPATTLTSKRQQALDNFEHAAWF